VEGTRVESVESAYSAGLGVQVFTFSGHNGFAAIDDPDEERALRAYERAAAAARAAQDAGLEANPSILSVPPETGRVVPQEPYRLDQLTVGEMREHAVSLAGEIVENAGDVHVRTSFSLSRADWRIRRSDGTDVSFRIPRSVASVSLTARRNGEAVRTSATATAMSYETLLDDRLREHFLGRARRAAKLALELLDAPSYPPGSYRLLVDFALAKGLAHEAFGHAAETDGLDASILGDAGRFRVGERFGAKTVSIIDESVDGDNAYQPFSGNGVTRGKAVILDHGVLKTALADVHTAKRAGTPVTGAGRLASFANVPLPRMTNIRIEVDDPVEVPDGKDFHDWRPEEVRDLLVASGDLSGDEKIVFLSGYRGGQVNPALGDFVFHSTALYELSVDEIRLFKPGIFSGRIEAALYSIARGYGPLRLDAAGTCGKAGQGVPSSGGSHHFLLIDENPEVRIGGRS
jgi:TldD protein